MKISHFSVEHKVTTTMLAGIVVIIGLVCLSRVGLDLMPEMDYPMISIITVYRGTSSEDIEKLVTKPIEEIIATIKNVKSLKSVSIESFSVIMVEFEWGTNLDFVAQDIRDSIALMRTYMPKDMDDPVVMKFNVSQMPVLIYAVRGMEDTLKLRAFVDDVYKTRLERLDGVASVMIIGGLKREINVFVGRTNLEANNLSIDQVVRALGARNLNLPAGHIQTQHRDYLVRTVSEYENLDEIRNTVVGMSKTGVTIHLRDIADVRDTHKEVRNYSRLNKSDSIVFMVSKESGANTLSVADLVKLEIKKISKFVPSGVELHLAMDQGDIIKQMTSQTANTGIVGGILAIFLMFLFLRRWQPTLVIAVAIPLSVVATFIAIYAVGYTLNFMTIAGLAVGIGMLVDNAVVVVENIHRHLEEGKTPRNAAKLGASEVGMAITASTLTTISVFFPLVFGGGMAGQISRGLSLTVAFSLFASLFVALTIVPMLASVLFRQGQTGMGKIGFRSGQIFQAFKEWYGRALRRALHSPRKVVVISLLLFVGSLALVPIVGTEFMPTMDQPFLTLKFSMPVGTCLDETDRVARLIEDEFADIPEVEVSTIFVGPDESDIAGIGMGLNPSDVHEGMAMVKLKKKAARQRSSLELTNIIRRVLPDIEGAKYEFIDMGKIMMSGGGSASSIEIKLFGKDIGELSQLSLQIIRALTNVEGLRDLDTTIGESKPEYHIRIDKDKAARYALSVAQVANAVRFSTLGAVATRYHSEGEEVDIRVRFQEKDRDEIDKIQVIPIQTLFSGQIPLREVAEVIQGEGPLKIDRENQSRRVSVTANIADRDLGSVIADIQRSIKPIITSMPSGYFFEQGGEYKLMRESFVTLGQALLLAMLLVYMVMASQFESFSHPLVIMFTLPLAVIGVVLIFLATGTTISLPTLLGVLILVGIAVNNGIVLIDYVNQLRRQGMKKIDALVRAGMTRLRPILITAGTTIFGLFPMALSQTEGSEIRIPLALTVIGGLVTTTILSLFVLPVIYSIIDRTKIQIKGM